MGSVLERSFSLGEILFDFDEMVLNCLEVSLGDLKFRNLVFLRLDVVRTQLFEDLVDFVPSQLPFDDLFSLLVLSGGVVEGFIHNVANDFLIHPLIFFVEQ